MTRCTNKRNDSQRVWQCSRDVGHLGPCDFFDRAKDPAPWVGIDDWNGRLPASACPHCGKVLDAATGLDAKEQPEVGDLSVCIGCGGMMAFGDGLVLRKLTVLDLVEMPRDVWEAMRDVSWAILKRIAEERSRDGKG